MRLLVAFAVAVALYLPTARFGFVQDDRAIIARNPAAHSIGAAVRAFDDPYWPPPTSGMYRPLTIASYALDWTLSGGRPGWMHVVNALLHGLATVLAVLMLSRWLPEMGALAAGLVFALHPVHVEGVASLVSRAELLAAVGIFGAVLAARRGVWWGALGCAAVAMFSKEHGVVAGAVILLDDWLQSGARPRYPAWFYGSLAGLTVGYLALWAAVGRSTLADVAPPFFGAGVTQRLAMALPSVWRAAVLLAWPARLSADYNPQVIPVREGFSIEAVLGALVVAGVAALAWQARRRAPLVSFAAGAAALAYLPTSNLFFPSGIVLAERTLYVPVLLPAAAVGLGVVWVGEVRGSRAALAGLVLISLVLGWRSAERLPAWRDNRALLLTLLEERPESYRAHASAAAVLAGIGDTAAARREYERADSLFPRDPHLNASHAFYLLSLGDTGHVGPLIARAREMMPDQWVALRGEFLLWLRRGDVNRAARVADTAVGRRPWEADWYRLILQRVIDSLRTAG